MSILKSTTLLLLLFVTGHLLTAQSVVGNLDGFYFPLKITSSNGLSILTKEVVIVTKEIAKESSSSIGRIGYTHKVPFLEFTSANKIETQVSTKSGSLRYALTFYNSKEERLITIYLPKKHVSVFTNKQEGNFNLYSIQINQIPSILFDKANQLDITKIVH